MSRILLTSDEAGLSGDMLVSSLCALGEDRSATSRVVEAMEMPIRVSWKEEAPEQIVIEGAEKSMELHEMDLRLYESRLPGDIKLPAMQLWRQRAAALKKRSISYDTAFDILSALLLCKEMEVEELIFPSPLVVGSSDAAKKLLPPHLQANKDSDIEMVTPTAASLMRAVSSRVDPKAKQEGGPYSAPKAVREVQGLFASGGHLPLLRAALFV